MYKDKYLKYKKKYLTLKKIGSGEKKMFLDDKKIIYNYLWIQQKNENEIEQDEKSKPIFLHEIDFDNIEKDYNDNELSNIIMLGMGINFGNEYSNFVILNKKSNIFKEGFKEYYNVIYEKIKSSISKMGELKTKDEINKFVLYMEDKIFKYIIPSGKKYYKYGKYYKKKDTSEKDEIIRYIKESIKINKLDIKNVELMNNIIDFVFYKIIIDDSGMDNRTLIDKEIKKIKNNLEKNEKIKIYLWLDFRRHLSKNINDTKTYLNNFCSNIEIKDLNNLALFQNDMIKNIYSDYYNYDFYYKVDLAKLLITLEQIYLDNSVYSIFTDIRVKVFSLSPENIVNEYNNSKLDKFGVLFIKTKNSNYENSFHIMKYNSNKTNIILEYICKLIIFIYNFNNNISISGYLNFFKDGESKTYYLNNYMEDITQLVFVSIFSSEYGNLKMKLKHANSMEGGNGKINIDIIDIITKTTNIEEIKKKLNELFSKFNTNLIGIFKKSFKTYTRGDQRRVKNNDNKKELKDNFSIILQWRDSRGNHKIRSKLPNNINFWYGYESNKYYEFGYPIDEKYYNKLTIYHVIKKNNNDIELEYYDKKEKKNKKKILSPSGKNDENHYFIELKFTENLEDKDIIHKFTGFKGDYYYNNIDNLYKYNIKLEYFRNSNLGIYHFFNEGNIFGNDSINKKFLENGFTIGENFGDRSSYGNLYNINIKDIDEELTDKYCIKIIKINPKDKHNISIDKIINEYIIQHYLEDTEICPKIYGFFYIKNINRNYIVNNIVINNINTFIYNNYNKHGDHRINKKKYLRYYENDLVILLMEKINKKMGGGANDEKKTVQKYDKIYIKKLFKLWDKGIIHNDLHSGNRIITDNDVYIIDFGHSYFINNLQVKYMDMLDKERKKLAFQGDQLLLIDTDVDLYNFINENYNTNDFIKLTHDNILKFYKLQEIKYNLLDRINKINITERDNYKKSIKKLKDNLNNIFDQETYKKIAWKQIMQNIKKKKFYNFDIRDAIIDLLGGEEEFGNSIGNNLPKNTQINFEMFSKAWDLRLLQRKKK